MRETPRPQGTADGSGTEPPQPRPGRALAHTIGASGSGSPHRSDRRPPHTPRGARHTGPGGRLGTTPPVPGRPALLSLLSLALFAVTTWQVAAGGPLARLDERVSRALAGRGPAPLTEFLADLGSLPVALPVLAAAVAYALWRGDRARALYAVAAMALVPAVVVPLKLLVDRVGPLTPETGYYPSGHTATALVAYCGAALLVHRRLVPVAVLLTVATGTGLVLRGYHWPLDVVASACLFSPICTRRSSGRTPSPRTGPS
ncbi:phosphatase PAP2 family protein [Streptomyces sp. WAC05374]|uniref:phosphatase PAP2 family protein n=1 Tax=Streptomyces sp. WAC05374 TaxID=2487420 RepID=UPI000F86B416|nr:phosphatase PAP2 family protein [Streptomyces sp. WAC05374]RST15633.1 phosphatase PAP2 family protein [Streptomyces sp. WAC05374]TDF38865.1 phosphatase PAP2 family protein [Streptomyces sp. WAC05374]TDF46821.1 phosphatase PAP2 family protein [Streptomyces sp. WAC05374]TDF48775.1 phosphatase PAP2 family protein [Streptomyces sp. WAC05374]